MKRFNRAIYGIVAIMFLGLLFGLNAAAGQKPLMMATTTSTDNTGLLDYLAPHFTKSTGIELRWTATGTGKALKLGANCDVDVVMVHAPSAEKKFIADGYGLNRKEIMYNDFVIIGPTADPAGVQGNNVVQALQDIAEHKAIFASRGDNSGTHKKELKLWQQANLPVFEKEPWYIQTGQGMLATINMAAERKGYTMTDRGTYIKYSHSQGGKPPLNVLVEGDAVLKNQYGIIVLNPEHCKEINVEGAQAFSDWLAGQEAQNLIKKFKLLGQTLFIPNAQK